MVSDLKKKKVVFRWEIFLNRHWEIWDYSRTVISCDLISPAKTGFNFKLSHLNIDPTEFAVKSPTYYFFSK